MTDNMASMPPGEAIWAMIIMVTVMLVVVLFFCCMPFYRALDKRWRHWDNPENDPRWNVDQFQFSPTSPQLGVRGTNNKYNRLSNASMIESGSSLGVSRGSSFRNICVLPRDPEQVEIQMPPTYQEIFNPGGGDDSSLGTPPAYYSESQSSEDMASANPKNETTNPSEKKVTPKKCIAAAPKKFSTNAKEVIDVPKTNTITPKNDTVAPKKDIPTPKKHTATQKKDTTTPKKDPAIPNKDTPKKDAATPKKDPTTPKKNNSTPNVITVTPAKPMDTLTVPEPKRKTYKKVKKTVTKQEE